MPRKIILSLLSALLLAMPWLTGLGGWTLFVAFVPLLILEQEGGRRFGMWVALAFAVWILLSAWWVSLATIIAGVAIPMVGLFFSWTPFMIFHWVRKRQSEAVAWVVLVTAWISFEALYTHQDISFPWLNLGNGFMQMPWAVQWYELTGTFGGTLWVLVANILFFRLWQNRRSWKRQVAAILWIALPLTLSVMRYATYTETVDPVRVCILQPNIDPYSEKFEGGFSQVQQVGIITDLMAKGDPQTEFFVAPETAIDDGLWEENIGSNPRIEQLRVVLESQFHESTIVVGAMTYRMKQRPDNGSRNFYVYNSALWIDTSAKVDIYHK